MREVVLLFQIVPSAVVEVFFEELSAVSKQVFVNDFKPRTWFFKVLQLEEGAAAACIIVNLW